DLCVVGMIAIWLAIAVFAFLIFVTEGGSVALLVLLGAIFFAATFKFLQFKRNRDRNREYTGSRYASVRHVNRIERQIRSAIELSGSAKEALEFLKRGPTRTLQVMQSILGAAAILGLLLTVIGVLSVGVLVPYWVLSLQTIEILGPIIACAIYGAILGMGLSACLLPFIIILQRQR